MIKRWSVMAMLWLFGYKRQPTYSPYDCIVWSGTLKRVS